MVHLFLLVQALLYHTRLTKSRYLLCAPIIQLKKLLCVDKIATREKLGSDRGANMRSSQQSLPIVISKQYQLYLGNE